MMSWTREEASRLNMESVRLKQLRKSNTNNSHVRRVLLWRVSSPWPPIRHREPSHCGQTAHGREFR